MSLVAISSFSQLDSKMSTLRISKNSNGFVGILLVSNNKFKKYHSGFYKHTTLAILALLPTWYSYNVFPSLFVPHPVSKCEIKISTSILSFHTSLD